MVRAERIDDDEEHVARSTARAAGGTPARGRATASERDAASQADPEQDRSKSGDRAGCAAPSDRRVLAGAGDGARATTERSSPAATNAHANSTPRPIALFHTSSS